MWQRLLWDNTITNEFKLETTCTQHAWRIHASDDIIPPTCKWGLLAVDIGQNRSSLDVTVPHDTAPAPLTNAEECAC
jgi:hypothetical protein